MKSLIVEDDFTSRLVLQTVLSRYGECHIAVNGKEAVDAFRTSVESNQKYDLICMDIMMPEMDGHEALRLIRDHESTVSQYTLSSEGVKIIMTTALGDIGNVSASYQGFCDAYLVKPVDIAKLLEEMRSLRLVQ
jgi:two-component system chemotaxis response regulator CheY